MEGALTLTCLWCQTVNVHAVASICIVKQTEPSDLYFKKIITSSSTCGLQLDSDEQTTQSY